MVYSVQVKTIKFRYLDPWRFLELFEVVSAFKN